MIALGLCMLQEQFGKILAEHFELDKLSEEELLAFYDRMGQIIIDAALGRLLLSLPESKVAELELYLESHKNSGDAVSYLLTTFPVFEEYLEEETLAFQREALRVVS